MRTSLSLVTAVTPQLADYLPETAASVDRLRGALRSLGWGVTWIVSIDGPGRLDVAGADEIVTQSRVAGVSATRNLGIAAARAGWLLPLDGDDVLDVDGCVELVTHPLFGSARWHPTNRVTLDGRPTAHHFNHCRAWEIGELEEHWTSPFPFHPNSVIAEVELAQAVGGYPALRVNEDIPYVFNLNRWSRGLSIPAVTIRYRQWPGQTVADPAYATDKARSFAAIATMVNARRALEGRGPIAAPTVHSPRTTAA